MLSWAIACSTLTCASYSLCVCKDIKISEIDESLWKMGMAYNHGYDKQGNHIGKQLGKAMGGGGSAERAPIVDYNLVPRL